MSYYYLQTSNDHLAHHGILGMRWGIRRFQPYPKGHRGGKEIGEAAKTKIKSKEEPSKAKIVAQKVKNVVTSKEFKTAAKIVGIGAAAAVGTAFIASPQGQVILATAVRSGIKMASDAKTYLNNKAWDAANSWNSWIDSKLGTEDYAKTDATLLDLDNKIKRDNKIETATLDASVRTLKSDVKVADAIMMKALKKNEIMVDKIQNDPETQRALILALQKMAIQSATKKGGISEEELQRGIEMAKKINIS